MYVGGSHISGRALLVIKLKCFAVSLAYPSGEEGKIFLLKLRLPAAPTEEEVGVSTLWLDGAGYCKARVNIQAAAYFVFLSKMIKNQKKDWILLPLGMLLAS
jgi:hypothetical protein